MTNTYGFAVSSNQTLVANFLATVQTQAGNTVTVNASAGGSVSGGGTFPAGTLVTNTETPSNGFVFIGWTGAASGTGNPLIVAANPNMTITANFAATTGGLTLTVLPNGPGAVSPNLNGQILQTGGSYTLTATPDDVGSMFSGWTRLHYNQHQPTHCGNAGIQHGAASQLLRPTHSCRSKEHATAVFSLPPMASLHKQRGCSRD